MFTCSTATTSTTTIYMIATITATTIYPRNHQPTDTIDHRGDNIMHTASQELSKNASNELISAVRVVACGADVALNVSFGAAEGWIEKKVVQYLESHITHLVNATICGAVEKVRAHMLAQSWG